MPSDYKANLSLNLLQKNIITIDKNIITICKIKDIKYPVSIKLSQSNKLMPNEASRPGFLPFIIITNKAISTLNDIRIGIMYLVISK